jgi:hypothetical protein
MRAPPKTIMSLPGSRLSSGISSWSRRRERRALFQSTAARLCEKTTLGSVFMSRAIGLSDPGQPCTMSS